MSKPSADVRCSTKSDWPFECAGDLGRGRTVEEQINPILEPGGTETRVGDWGARRYRKPLHKIRWSDIVALLQESLSCWSKHQAPRMGAALAFYTLLSLMPLVLVIISIAGLVLGAPAAQAGVMGQMELLLGSQRAQIVQTLLEGAQNKAGGLLATVVGMLTLLFGASSMLGELRDDLNTIWDVPTPRMNTAQEIASMVRGRLWSFALILGIGCLLTILLLLNTWISALGKLYTSVVPSHEVALHSLNAVFSFVVITGLFGAIYKIVPDVEIEWRDVALGAAFTSLCFTVGNLLLGLYLGKTSFSSTYGAAASTVVLTVWVYYSSQVFFLGAEFTRAFSARYGSCPRQSTVIDTGASAVVPRPGAPGTPLVTPGR